MLPLHVSPPLAAVPILVRLLMAGGFLLVSALAALASPQSKQLIAKGVDDLKAMRFEDALKKFEDAEMADPLDGEAPFFQGVALNRLGRHADALANLARVAGLTAKNAELRFETGWALMGVGEHRRAIASLKQFEKLKPRRGQTSEFRGRAHFHLGELDKAEALLNEAMERDARLKPTARLYLATIEQRRGNPAAGAEQLRKMVEESPHAPLSDMIRRQAERVLPPITPVAPVIWVRPWRASVLVGGGWNSNVIALGSGVPLPADITSKESAFARLAFFGEYQFLRKPDSLGVAGWTFLSDTYKSGVNADLLDNYWYALLQQRLGESVWGGVRVSDQFSVIGGNPFRNRVEVRPSLAFPLTRDIALEFSFTFAASDHFFPKTIATDRDGTSQTFGVMAYIAIPNAKWRAQLGVSHSAHTADGPNFDYDSTRVSVGVTRPLFFGVDGEVTYSRLIDRYDNPNSFSATGAVRNDDVDLLSVQFSRELPPVGKVRPRLYFRYEHIRNSSNVPTFDYRQNIVSGGGVGGGGAERDEVGNLKTEGGNFSHGWTQMKHR